MSKRTWLQKFKLAAAHNQANVVFSAVIMVATVTYAVISLIELGPIRKSAEASKISAGAAQVSADAAQESALTAQRAERDARRASELQLKQTSDSMQSQQKTFEIDQRPYMVVDGPPVFSGNGFVANKEITVNITFKNIGRTPAIKYVMHGRVFRFDPAKGDEGRKLIKRTMWDAFGQLEKKDAIGRREVERVHAESDVAPNGTVFITEPNTADDPVILGNDDLPKISNGLTVLFYIGVVSYTDSFGIKYKTEFCQAYLGDDPKIWHICDNHNTIQ